MTVPENCLPFSRKVKGKLPQWLDLLLPSGSARRVPEKKQAWMESYPGNILETRDLATLVVSISCGISMKDMGQ